MSIRGTARWAKPQCFYDDENLVVCCVRRDACSVKVERISIESILFSVIEVATHETYDSLTMHPALIDGMRVVTPAVLQGCLLWRG